MRDIWSVVLGGSIFTSKAAMQFAIPSVGSQLISIPAADGEEWVANRAQLRGHVS
jgi:hypothetical protein